MTIIKKAVPNRNVVLMAALLTITSPLAFTAGFEEATQMATDIRSNIYAFIGVIAGIALLWCFFMGWSGRKTWADILDIALWIFGAAAAFSLAAFLWAKGGGVSF